MAISFPVSMPSTPGFVTSKFRLMTNTALFESSYDRTQQTLERPGARWAADFALPPMANADARDWVAFLTSLRGLVGTFNGYDPSQRTPRGTATGTPLVDGGSQTGRTLNTKGWSTGVTGIMKAGDYIAFANRFHMVVEDADSDGSGDAALSIEPPLRESPAGDAAITVTNPTVIMRLTSDQAEWDVNTALHYGISFSGIEVL